MKAHKTEDKFDQTYGYYPVMLSDKYKKNKSSTVDRLYSAGWGGRHYEQYSWNLTISEEDEKMENGFTKIRSGSRQAMERIGV